MATGQKVPQQIFAVDTNTGQVYIAGNLFVQSAEKAGDSWIVGDMISASSVIELKDGAIVLDGVNGRITVFDPGNMSNGNYIRIEHGLVRQYEGFTLKRQLVNLETGVAYNGEWKILEARYDTAPSILISPLVMNTFTPERFSQAQRLDVKVERIESLGSGKYRFLPKVLLAVDDIDLDIQPPPKLEGWYLAPYDYGNYHPEITATTNSVIIRGSVKVTVEAAFYSYTDMWDGLSYDSGPMLGLIGRWRAKYRQGEGDWQYSDYVTRDIPPNNGKNELSNSLVFNLDSGEYEVCFEWTVALKSPRERGYKEDLSTGGLFKITRILLSEASADILEVGTVRYLAVGE